MCCLRNKKDTLRIKKRLESTKGKWIWCYKQLRIRGQYWDKAKIIISSIFYHYVWQPGWNETDSKAKYSTNGNAIHLGIHVYYRGYSSYDCRWVKVKCYLEDFIGADGYEAVFRKVYLPKAEYDRVMSCA